MKNGKSNFGFSYIMYIKYGKFWSISLELFVKHKLWNWEEWHNNVILNWNKIVYRKYKSNHLKPHNLITIEIFDLLVYTSGMKALLNFITGNFFFDILSPNQIILNHFPKKIFLAFYTTKLVVSNEQIKHFEVIFIHSVFDSWCKMIWAIRHWCSCSNFFFASCEIFKIISDDGISGPYATQLFSENNPY